MMALSIMSNIMTRISVVASPLPAVIPRVATIVIVMILPILITRVSLYVAMDNRSIHHG